MSECVSFRDSVEKVTAVVKCIGTNSVSRLSHFISSLSYPDVVTIDKTGENFRLLYDVKGRFTVHRIMTEEAKVSHYHHVKSVFPHFMEIGCFASFEPALSIQRIAWSTLQKHVL